jgi:hypothetical protein
VQAAVGRLAEACGGELILERSLDGPVRGQHDAIDWRVPAASLTSLNPDTPLSAALSAVGRRRELRLPASWAVGPDAQELVRAVAKAAEGGCDGFLFDHLGLLPDRGLNTVRQALRFARRSGGAPV